eukprot:GFKZ01012951.1.p1 GENE.GFKZ01012951.1~~GFKZ01012951.1.p1  ORF type:complete len:107 (+),score=1.09 GFKZ01012951.1:356-676(+)
MSSHHDGGTSECNHDLPAFLHPSLPHQMTPSPSTCGQQLINLPYLIACYLASARIRGCAILSKQAAFNAVVRISMKKMASSYPLLSRLSSLLSDLYTRQGAQQHGS